MHSRRIPFSVHLAYLIVGLQGASAAGRQTRAPDCAQRPRGPRGRQPMEV